MKLFTAAIGKRLLESDNRQQPLRGTDDEIRMCCNFQKTARERLVGSTRLRLMQPPRTAC